MEDFDIGGKGLFPACQDHLTGGALIAEARRIAEKVHGSSSHHPPTVVVAGQFVGTRIATSRACESSTETCSAFAMTATVSVGAERSGIRRGNLTRSAYTALDVTSPVGTNRLGGASVIADPVLSDAGSAINAFSLLPGAPYDDNRSMPLWAIH